MTVASDIEQRLSVAVLLVLVVLAGVVLSGCATATPNWPVPPGLL